MSASTRSSLSDIPGGSSQDFVGERDTYRWTGQVTECPGVDPGATWGVQFCTRPSQYQMKGGALCWQKRIAERRATDRRPPPAPSAADAASASASRASGIAESSSLQQQTPRPREAGDELDEPMKVLPGRVWRNLFATVNGGCVRIYEANAHRKPTPIGTFKDEDGEEIFYCVAWAYNASNDGAWWVCAAGKKGIIRVINVKDNALEKSLVGHGEAVNDVKVHPRDPALLVSASKDESLRLWNLRTGSSIAVFAGLKGHRGEVVSVDFNSCGDRFASCGIDNSIRVWEIMDDDMVIDAIAESHNAADMGVTDTFLFQDENESRKRITVPIRQFPCFVTRKVHKHYVDCVMWVGDLLLSKSVHNRIYLWEPGSDRESLAAPATSYTLLEEYCVDACNVWFIRFALDRCRRTIACGNEKGVVYLFRIGQTPSKPMCMLVPKDRSRNSSLSYVRQCAFSDDGSIILAVDDSSNVTQYDRVGVGMPLRPQRSSTASMSD